MVEEQFYPGFKQKVVEKKEVVLFGQKEAYTEEELKEAEEHVESMQENLGSLEAVSVCLDLETLAKELGIEKEFFEIIGQLQQAVSQDLSELINQGLERQRQDKDFNIFEFVIGRFMKLNDALYAKLIIDSPELSKLSQENSDQFLALTMLWSELQERMQAALVLKYSDSNGGEAPPPGKGLSLLEQQEQRVGQALRLSTASAAKPPKKPEGPPPPPVPPEDYEEVEPANLEDIEWPNGDAIHFSPTVVLEDSKGRKRQFYQATYEYTPEDSDQKINIDLSQYIPGKNVIFEGTSGAITGASLDPSRKYGGWATPLQEQGYYLVALNMDRLLQGPKGMMTVFHELGHVYLFGEEEKKILDDRPEKKPKSKAMSAFRKAFKSSEPENEEEERPRGINMYRDEVLILKKNVEQRISEGEASLLNLEARTDSRSASQDPEVIKLRDKLAGEIAHFKALKSLMETHNISSRQYLYLSQNTPGLGLLRSIFHERMADTFALKQVRKLKSDLMMSRSEMREDWSYNLKAKAKIYNDPRYNKGLKA